MKFEIKGKIILIDDTQQITDNFKKREFVIEVENERNSDWNDFVKFQVTQDRCDILDACHVGQEINVHFNIRGRRWEKDGKVNYFSNLECWRIEKLQDTTPPEFDATKMPPPLEEDDLPF
jgi:hypothetical protein